MNQEEKRKEIRGFYEQDKDESLGRKRKISTINNGV